MTIVKTIKRSNYTLEFTENNDIRGVDITIHFENTFFDRLIKSINFLFTGNFQYVEKLSMGDLLEINAFLDVADFNTFIKENYAHLFESAKKHFHKEDIPEILVKELELEKVYKSADLYRVVQKHIKYSIASLKIKFTELANTYITVEGERVFFKVVKIQGVNYYSLHVYNT